MTQLLTDIRRQPAEVRNCLARHAGTSFSAFTAASQSLPPGCHVFVVGIGASYNAGHAVAAALCRAGRLATLADASEFQHRADLFPESRVLFLSRSGRSIELVNAASRCAASKMQTVAITNDPDSPLAARCSAHICLHVDFDRAVSIVTYSTLLLAGVLLAAACRNLDLHEVTAELCRAADATETMLGGWKDATAAVDLRPVYFLGRGPDLASAMEGMLLWQEVVKSPATAMSTGSFRHGPQEVLRVPLTVVLWASAGQEANDSILVRDLARLGADVTVIGMLPGAEAARVIGLPAAPSGFEPVFNCIPVQLLAEATAVRLGVDPDTLVFSSYIVEREGGLR